MRRLALAAIGLVALAILFFPGIARAYPQFQFSTGNTRCNLCHFSPAGGGLINDYGRDEAGDTISSGGDGGFLHGAWKPPPWLALGADVRVAGLLVNEGATEGADLEAFPMQFDLYGRVELGDFSLYLNVGLRGDAFPGTSSNIPAPFSMFISREHTITWRPGRGAFYLRVGRFFPVYGLRVAEHPSYIEQDLGFDLLEETYGVAAEWMYDDWELHLTAFLADPITPVGDGHDNGAAAYFERRFDQKAAVGAEFRAGFGPEDKRIQGGFDGKYYWKDANLLFLGEVDLVRQIFDGTDLPSRSQLAAYLGATWFIRQGLMFQGILERWDEDLSVAGVARDAITAELQWFPYAHFEVSLWGRQAWIGTGSNDGSPETILLLQLHYYL